MNVKVKSKKFKTVKSLLSVTPFQLFSLDTYTNNKNQPGKLNNIHILNPIDDIQKFP